MPENTGWKIGEEEREHGGLFPLDESEEKEKWEDSPDSKELACMESSKGFRVHQRDFCMEPTRSIAVTIDSRRAGVASAS